MYSIVGWWRVGILCSMVMGLIGCGVLSGPESSVTHSSVTHLPDWVSHPQKATSQQLFGIGQGPSLAEAKQMALQDVAGSLRVSIQSELASRQTYQQGVVSEASTSWVKSRIAQLPIEGAQLTRSALSDGTYFVQVGVARQDLLAGIARQLDTATRDLSKVSVSDLSPWEAWRTAQQEQVMLQQAMTLAAMMKVVDPNLRDPGAAYQARWQALNEKRAKLTVCLSPQDATARAFVQQWLMASGSESLPLTQCHDMKDPSSAQVVVVKLMSHLQTRVLMGEYRAHLVVSLNTLMAGASQNAAHTQQEAQGISLRSAEAAQASAVRQLVHHAKQRGRAVFLGLQAP